MQLFGKPNRYTLFYYFILKTLPTPQRLSRFCFSYHSPRFHALVDRMSCYVNKPEFGIECVTKVVDAAIENGVYVIIDWHSHNLRQEEAKEFFTQMATRYKGVPNVIYEVFNEPVEDSWEQVKSYSVEVIKTIRAIEPDAVILVGCPHWDQDIHLAADDPITGYSNIMYTLHFYANTHGQWLRDHIK